VSTVTPKPDERAGSEAQREELLRREQQARAAAEAATSAIVTTAYASVRLNCVQSSSGSGIVAS